MYFTKETEQAIIDYNDESRRWKKNQIYNTSIYVPLCKLAENIFNTFKFSYFEVSPTDIQSEVVSFMTSQLPKYAAGKGKAYSYFSIVAKHWLIHRNNNTYNQWKRHTEILDQHEEDTHGEILVADNDTSDEPKELLNLTIDYWDRNVSRVFIKKKEMEIAFAVLELFRMSERIENFNKKAIYLYIREISGCKAQNITKVLNKMRSYQRDIFEEYYNTGKVSLNQHDMLDNEFFDEQ